MQPVDPSNINVEPLNKWQLQRDLAQVTTKG